MKASLTKDIVSHFAKLMMNYNTKKLKKQEKISNLKIAMISGGIRKIK